MDGNNTKSVIRTASLKNFRVVVLNSSGSLEKAYDNLGKTAFVRNTMNKIKAPMTLLAIVKYPTSCIGLNKPSINISNPLYTCANIDIDHMTRELDK